MKVRIGLYLSGRENATLEDRSRAAFQQTFLNGQMVFSSFFIAKEHFGLRCRRLVSVVLLYDQFIIRAQSMAFIKFRICRAFLAIY